MGLREWVTVGAAVRHAAAAGLAASVALLWMLLSGAPAGLPPVLPVLEPQANPPVERAYASLPLAFEPNAERGDPRVDYLSRTSAGTVYIGDRGASLTLGDAGRREVVGLRLTGSAPARPVPHGRLPGVVNDLRGDDPARWRTGIPTFRRVEYRSVYPGVDVLWHGNSSQLEYDFHVAPRADPERIRLRVSGADALRVAANGDLVIRAGEATVRQRAPVAYQPSGAGRRAVRADFRVDGRSVWFELGSYDRTRSLVIDPLVLNYSTYLGGGGSDGGAEIAVDSAGAAYIAGRTDSVDFDTVNQIEGDSDIQDAFVAKLAPGGNSLVYSTYLGGSGNDAAQGLAVGGDGAAYITGVTTSTDFDTVSPIEGDSGAQDVFVAKVAPAGNSLVYSTYLGGGASDSANGIAVDTAGAAYIVGGTASADFDTTASRFEGDTAGNGDAFVAKVAPSGSSLDYSTYLGGDSEDVGNAIALGPGGAAYIMGDSSSSNFDTTANRVEGDTAGSQDTFTARVDPTKSGAESLVYSTYLGGNGVDFAAGIAVDQAGDAYVMGSTDSSDFDTTASMIEGDTPGSRDVFVSRIDPATAGTAGLEYSTYLGGDALDAAGGIVLDSAGAAYVVGSTQSVDFNTVQPVDPATGDNDVFLAKIDTAVSGAAGLVYSTDLGGAGQDNGSGVAVDAAGAAYLTGFTLSTDYDTLSPIEGDSGGSDVIVSKLTLDTDGDGIGDLADNCPSAANADQADNDSDGSGDACDADDDNDGVVDTADNCPLAANADQADGDGDGAGDVCDADDDNDGVVDTADNCPLAANADQANNYGDARGDACEEDRFPPVVSSFSVRPRRFAAMRSGSSIAAQVRRGARVRYALSERARVKFTVKRRGTLRRGQRRTVRGSFSHRGAKGNNRFKFTGRLRRKKLVPGRYWLLATPRDAAGNKGQTKRAAFVIVRG